jgi:hypothetical protein
LLSSSPAFNHQNKEQMIGLITESTKRTTTTHIQHTSGRWKGEGSLLGPVTLSTAFSVTFQSNKGKQSTYGQQ